MENFFKNTEKSKLKKDVLYCSLQKTQADFLPVFSLYIYIHFPGGSVVKNSPAMQEKQGQEDPLEKGMATHSSMLAWEIPWTEEPGRLQSWGHKRVGHD